MSLEELFEEMFGESKKEAPKENKVPEKEEPKKPSEEKEWPRLDTSPFEEEKSLHKPSGLPCSTCGSRDATYSPHYKDQWCINCWF